MPNTTQPHGDRDLHSGIRLVAADGCDRGVLAAPPFSPHTLRHISGRFARILENLEIWRVAKEISRAAKFTNRHFPSSGAVS